ncbi:MarR family winged helix-turn-helix transcriptional regulator [Curtobacterium sp. MCBD17_013]|uniref:MarR family winged helix-turn-helix transcriptional regulator n=1 Tax=Curtobacterium sp. MCBD17_013 TaxID=2175668 RepID=UPI0015E8B218|nr:MarR family winged helix-turn-helix transcriptional regulator [Curtobacterium sp. MCBD17_013]
MTSGATTVLLNRLEAAGHIVGSREGSDRRRVTLRPVREAREQARAFLAFSGAQIAGWLRETPDPELATVIAFLERMTAAARQANARLARGARGGQNTG